MNIFAQKHICKINIRETQPQKYEFTSQLTYMIDDHAI